MIVCCIVCGISLFLSVWAVWRSLEIIKTINVLIKIVKHIDTLYESVSHIYDYLLHDHNDGEEEGLR